MTSALRPSSTPVGACAENSAASSRRLIGVSVSLAFYLDSATLVCIAVNLPVWRTAFRLSPWHVGLLGGGLALAMATGSLFGGHLGDRFGRLRVFTLDLVVFTIGAVVLLRAEGPYSLLSGALLVGIAAGADIPTGLAALAQAGPAGQRGRRTATTQVAWIAAVLVTYALAVAVSDLGLLGARLLVAHLLLLALVTLALRTRLVHLTSHTAAPRPVRSLSVSPPPQSSPPASSAGGPGARRGALGPVLLVGAFYIVWNVAAATLGSFGTYFLVTVTGLRQQVATGLVLVTFFPAAGMAFAFTRLADTAWRDRLFPVAALLQVAAFAVGAASGGRAVAGMVAAIVLYSLSNVFGGEAVYKVWAQLVFTERLRATALGATYAAARIAAAGFLLVVPLLIAARPAVLLWLLTGLVIVSGGLGVGVVRYLRNRSTASHPAVASR